MNSMKKLFDFLASDEYAEKQREIVSNIAKGQKIVYDAYEKNLISEAELWRLMASIEINGGLIVNHEMAKLMGNGTE